MNITVKARGLTALGNLLQKTPTKIGADVRSFNQTFALHAQSVVQELAPRRTGRYADSIQVEVTADGIIVWTEAPQAMRLEYGYVGVDSLGRHYAQAPQAHWGPATDQLVGEYVEGLRNIITRRLGS